MSEPRGSGGLLDEQWLLPTGVGELLPPEARRLESMRRELIDLFDRWGYELVMPSFLEYLESLLTGPGADLELQTFKVIDQESGRLMGVRADMTPQIARIDARYMTDRVAPVRLCYIGTVLHARPNPFFGSRSPLQVGAEIYGHAGVESDVEVMALMLAMLECVGLENIHLDVGHYGIYRAMVGDLGLSETEEKALFDALQRKAPDDIEQTLDRANANISMNTIDRIIALNDLNGGREVLNRAHEVAGCGSPEWSAAIAELESLAYAFEQRLPGVELHFDLAELRGYGYHGGAVFAAFVPGFGQEVARGGRYDQMSEDFGRARPATGFSADLRLLMGLRPRPASSSGQNGSRPGIYAPAHADEALIQTVAVLRAAGERVVEGLPDQRGGASELDCDRQLVQRDGRWEVVSAG